MRRIPFGLFAAAVLALQACDAADHQPIAPPPVPTDLKRYLAPGAAVQVDSEGRFAFGKALPPAHLPIISSERAGALARAFLRTWGHRARPSWEHQRGGPVDLGGLRMDPRILYAETPHAPYEGAPHPAYIRKYGPVYMVHFNHGDHPVLMIGVSAYATDLEIDADGRVVAPTLGGAYFFPVAVSLDPRAGPTRYVPITPEQAVERTASATGARARQAPRLVLRDRHWHPSMAQWEVQLEGPVRVALAKTGRPISVDVVFVGSGGTLSVPRAAQPAAKRLHPVLNPGRPDEPARHGSVDLPRRPGFPLEYDEVTAGQESGQ